ncbi:AAA family ATPase [Alkalimonas delamerensis]|uniref:AAA family ATPase n=1 Tax=Alkalimonas delamerensis TaxID=265981 RepID=A0ABT9GLN2_9GAMM|nr:AAA family ATPase [Alkalimonas delamerensis]MDP4527710.1 AAA family ATPase [Alkalimonas delamerensis]
MYTGFFGLHSQPFSIAPNPDFLYLSGRHAEALAHLRYGLGDAGGFVLLTGEVGTGKTTVSRALLQELDETTELAFILNPTLSELELLATICDELRIRYKKSDASLKMLGDKIKNRLLKNHQQGKQTLLIIDEAQHLQPVVLEQLRLLTNLETNSQKLLQVILIGQPELQQLLQRSDLRQLAQRITARYHLMPLTEAEVQQYLAYRLKIAGSERPVFDAAARRQLYQRSQGIPRLLNLLADRAMLAAYARQKPLVGKAEVQQAAKEVLPASVASAQLVQPGVWLWLLALVPLMAALGYLLARWLH